MPLSELFVQRLSLSEPIPEDRYYRNLPVIRALSEMEALELQAPVTFFVGENGAGKSTLLEAIAVKLGFNPEGGSANYLFSTRDSHGDLWEYLTVSRGFRRPRTGYFLRAESFYNAASYLDAMMETDVRTLSSYGGVSLHEQSHGESFLSLVENRFGEQGLYLLDEPEAALSPTGQMKLLCLMQDLVRQGSQFLISTHAPILMTFPGAQVLELSEDGIREVAYDQTEHFRLTKQFLNAPERMLRALLED